MMVNAQNITCLPQPLVSADVDLRDFPYMPLDVLRIRDSEIATLATGDQFRCAVLLWCAAWHQVPAASLPDDDALLSQLAGFGRVVKEWKKVRAGALRGWVKCSDGRLYHPVVAEKAREAWQARLNQRWRTECARIKKLNDRNKTNLPVPDFETWQASLVPEDSNQMSLGTKANVPEDKPECPEGLPPHVPREMASKGREGKGREVNTKPEAAPPASNTVDPAGADAPPEGENPPENPDHAAGKIAAVLRAMGAKLTGSHPTVQAWATDGIPIERITEAMELAKQRKPGEPIGANYLDPIVRNPPKKAKPYDDWDRSNEGIDRKGRELGMRAKGGESYHDYKGRIWSAIRLADKEVA